MRISDWSSDVCSSDLPGEAVAETLHRTAFLVDRDQQLVATDIADRIAKCDQLFARLVVVCKQQHANYARCGAPALLVFGQFQRSEERRVGKECVSTCRSRGTANH